MVETIFSNPLAVEAILPFLLVFVLVFAILQKSKILGDGKKQVDALIAAVMGLIVISFSYAVYIINNLIPFLAVSLVIILVFMLLLGSLFKEGSFELHKGVKVGIGILIFIAVVIAVLVITNTWSLVVNAFEGDSGSGILANIIFLLLIGGAIAAVWFGGSSGGSGKSS